MDQKRNSDRGITEDRISAAVEETATKIVRAYEDLARLMANDGCTLEELQGAAEYLLDAFRAAQQNAVSVKNPPGHENSRSKRAH